MYLTRDYETGTTIDEFATYEEAEKAIARYEEEDKKNGNYTPDFYEIVDKEKRFVVFEEEQYVKNGRVYDLLQGEFATLEEAIKCANDLYNHTWDSERVPLFVADADAYYDGNYDYLYTIGL